MLLAANIPRSKVTRILHCDEKSIEKIIIYWVEKAVENQGLAGTKNLAIDETSFKKGHSYVTLVIDSDERKVIEVQPGKDKIAVQKFAEKLENNGCGRDENKRVPMIWDSEGTGLTYGPPNMERQENRFADVETQLADENSILNYYKRVLRICNENPCIARGTTEVINLTGQDAVHRRGIGVILDVVYNHTYSVSDSPFEKTFPGYFYRFGKDGKLSNGSGCGNEFASERAAKVRLTRNSGR